MSRIAKNAIASFGGATASAIFNLVFTVAYFRLLGGESYGLVIFCITILNAASTIVESGISRTATRELARRDHSAELAQEMHDVLLTLQVIHFALTLICAFIIVGLSHWLALEWLHRDQLNSDESVRAIMLVGAIAIVQFPRALFNAALTGLQRQVFLNACSLAFVSLRGVATIAALFWIAPSPTVFLAVQLVVSGIEAIVLFVSVWRLMPRAGRRARFEMRFIREIWAFATADAGAMLIGVAISVGDRMLLSFILPLETFGVYGLVVQIADVIQRVGGPFTGAYFPYFVDLIARKNYEQLSHEYHRITVIINALAIPATFLICFFPSEILQLVTGKTSVIREFAPVLAVRTLATTLNTVQWFPHIVQLAIGLSSFGLVVNIIAAMIYLSGIFFLTPIYGVIVPAALWLLVNLLQVAPMIMVTHQRILVGEALTWVEGSVLRPTLVSFAIVLVGRYFSPATVSWLITVPWMAATYLVAMVAVLLTSKRTRALLTVMWP